ncbi:MAG: hypothetical protein GWN31_10125 [Candidatus Thorarchaeota archaeon]|nr:hypothetical protein [Candidatus Thorarchaeota archaeon]
MANSRDAPYHVTIEIENRQCRSLSMLKDSGIKQYSLTDIRGLPKGPTRHLVRTSLKAIDKTFRTKLSRIPDSIYGGEESAWFDSDGCDVCGAVLSQDSFLISGRHIGDFTMIYSFVAPTFKAYQQIITSLESKGWKLKILEVGRFRSEKHILTETQERTLLLALRLGFFEVPRRITMRELSDRLQVALSTLSENIRSGLRRLVEEHFKT